MNNANNCVKEDSNLHPSSICNLKKYVHTKLKKKLFFINYFYKLKSKSTSVGAGSIPD